MKIAENTNIYNALSDDMSRLIYEKRIMYNLTSNARFLGEMMVAVSSEWQEFVAAISNVPKEKRVLLGAGMYGKVLQSLVDFNFCIDNKSDTVVFPIEVVKTDEFLLNSQYYKKRGVSVAVALSPYENAGKAIDEVCKQLTDAGFSSCDIHHLPKLKYENSYFELPQLSLRNDEVFVDIGAFDSNDTCNFFDICKGYKNCQAIVFEPDIVNYKKCQENLKGKKVTFVNKGLWSESRKIFFDKAANCTFAGNLYVASLEETDLETDVITLDDFFSNGCVKPTYIKMDIEGAELKCLMGGKNTISLFRPKMAVCVYHKPEDIFEIPAYLLSLCPNYKFWLRKYTMSPFYELVLYAIEEK